MIHGFRLYRFTFAILAGALVAACGDDSSKPDPDVGTDTSVETDTSDDVLPDAPDDVTPDADTEADTDDGSGDADVTPDADTLEPEFDFRAAWTPPALEWDTCTEGTSTGRTLAEKAAYYDWIVPALHMVPDDTPGHEEYSRVFHVRCDAEVPDSIVDDEELPSCTFDRSENTGLWTGLYTASQAFRYAVTGEEEALDNLKRALRAARQSMRITAVPGNFTRDFRNPDLPQMACPEDVADYIPPGEDMVGNRWVRVDDDGCFLTWDPELEEGSGDWARDEEHCVDTEFAGFCWQRNMSKDEMAGQAYAAGVAAKVVDDEEVQALAAELLGAIGHHLADNDYWITDYDGRETRFGSAHALSLDHLPGFQAMIALTWMRSAATVTGDEALVDEFHYCLLQRDGPTTCIERGAERPRSYLDHMETDFSLKLGCQTNFDNVGMLTLSYLNLMWFEPDPERVAFYREQFHRGSRGPDSDGRDLWSQGNPQLNFTLAAMMGAEPEVPADATELVRDGICSLRAFHNTKRRNGVDVSGYETQCVSDRHGNLADAPLPMADRCVHTFEWWGDPNQIETCTEDLTRAAPPADYLLPYWMGRYFGFISAEM